MRYFFLTRSFFFFLIGLPIISNNQSLTDSLKNKLQTASGDSRVEILLSLSDYSTRSQPDSALEYANEALIISNKTDDFPIQAETLTKLGFLYNSKSMPSKALESYTKALNIYLSLDDKSKQADIYLDIGQLYQSQDIYRKSLENLFKSLEIRQKLNDTYSAAESMYYIGTVFHMRENFDEAILYYSQAYEASQKSDNLQILAMAVAELGIIHQNNGNFDESIHYFEIGLSTAKELNSIHVQATIMSYMSGVYMDKKVFTKAIELNENQIQLGRENSNDMIIAQGYENLASVYEKQGQIPNSFYSLNKAKAIYDSLGYRKSKMFVQLKLTDMYLNNNSVDSAINLSHMILDSAISLNMNEIKIKALNRLSTAYSSQNKYKNALQYQNQLAELKDSVYTREKEEIIAKMETRYETNQKEKEIELLEQQRQKDKLIRYIFIIGIIALLTIGGMIYNQLRLRFKKNKTLLVNKKLKEKQLKQDIEFKNKQLTTHSLNMVQKNETMKELKSNIDNIQNEVENPEVKKKLRGVQHLVDYSFNLDKDWKEFRHYFEKVHNGFYKKLTAEYPELTPKELRLSALVKLQLSSKEISTIMGITPDSVKTARYRLRKKLDMETEENLTDFMIDVEKSISK